MVWYQYYKFDKKRLMKYSWGYFYQANKIDKLHNIGIIQVVKVSENRKFPLIYLVVYIISKQVMIVLKDRRFFRTYLIVYINQSYHKVLENRKIFLIHLISYNK